MSQSDNPTASEDHQAQSPATHYLGALVITAIVTGISFLIKDPTAKWLTFAVAAVMDVGVLLAAATDLLRRPRS